MDITTLFKACVKTVRTTNKSLGEKDQKSNLLKSHKDANLQKAREIVRQITHLQSFLLENKAAYLNVINYLSTNKTMTEIDRDQVDSAAEQIVSTCTNLIGEYRKDVAKLAKSEQKKEHYDNVVQSLEKYLKTVSKIYTEAKAVRVKRVIDTHKLSKLTMQSSPKKQDLNATSKSQLETSAASLSPTTTTNNSNFDDDFTAEEMQMFESENELLFNELNSVSDEVKHMESKVVHIAELQEMFTEKVLQQEQDIDRIATIVAGSTDNVRDANEQIRQAIQRNSGLRVWILFFLLVMSFSLLFLDWYNE